jgi:cyclopropane fatty-acyl-phospholipid synthase-like methyltransferase
MDGNNTSYWDRFYSEQHHDIEVPSTFARECVKNMRRGQLLLELGCGNGRDAMFFARSGIKVIACDKSKVAIDDLRRRSKRLDVPHPPSFVCADFSRLGDQYAPDIVYSRFTLHAVAADEASRALRWSFDRLPPGGQLFIEARSIKGSLYGRGEPVGRDEFFQDGHYRRFLRIEELADELRTLGYTIRDAIESAGLAVHDDDDPVLIRMAAEK